MRRFLLAVAGVMTLGLVFWIMDVQRFLEAERLREEEFSNPYGEDR